MKPTREKPRVMSNGIITTTDWFENGKHYYIANKV